MLNLGPHAAYWDLLKITPLPAPHFQFFIEGVHNFNLHEWCKVVMVKVRGCHDLHRVLAANSCQDRWQMKKLHHLNADLSFPIKQIIQIWTRHLLYLLPSRDMKQYFKEHALFRLRWDVVHRTEREISLPDKVSFFHIFITWTRVTITCVDNKSKMGFYGYSALQAATPVIFGYSKVMHWRQKTCLCQIFK